MSTLRERVARLSSAQRAALERRLGVDAAAPPSAARLVAWVVPSGAPPAADTLRTFLRERLPEPMVPAAFVSIDALPRTPAGKLDAAALPHPRDAAPDPPGGFVPPAGAVEETLAAIWADVLGGVRVGVHDNFFEIGGDSILSIQVVARAARAGLRLSPDQLFRHQTVATLAGVVDTAPLRAPGRDPVDGPVPLTAIQHWFFEQPLPAPGHWHHVVWLEAPRDLDADRLGAALRRLLVHHGALRLRFHREGEEWKQTHGDTDARPTVRRIDLGSATGADLDRAQREAADALAAATDLTTGPLAVALIATRTHAPPRIALVVHHLVVDPISWQILIDDLNACYADPGRELPPPAASFRAWAAACAASAASDALREELEYWSAADRPETPLPRDLDGAFTEAGARTVARSLGADETRMLLDDVPGAYGTRGDEVLLTALVRTLAAWTGTARQRIGIERHGREAIDGSLDPSRTVGWFTAFFPVTLTLPEGGGPGEAIRAIKEQMRAVPRRGIGYGLARYLAPREEDGRRPGTARDPDVIFNYAGRGSLVSAPAAPFQPVSGPDSLRDPRNGRSHSLEVNAFVRDGRLEVRWTYGTGVFRADTIAMLAERFVEELRTLIAHCAEPGAGGFTPSDFPEAGLSQDELDRFLGGFSP